MKQLLFILLCTHAMIVKSQNVAINAVGVLPNVSAMLDIASTNTGLLIPRIALVATNNNAPVGASVATSLLIYNTATAGVTPNNVVPGFYYWNGTIWVALSGGTGGNDWSLLGNAGTVAGTNFIGTTDNVALKFKVNNQNAGIIGPNGSTFFGYNAGNVCPIVSSNVGFGTGALASCTNAIGLNTAIGTYALTSDVDGYYNTAIGSSAMYNNIDGHYNISIGNNSLYTNSSGSQNISIGWNSMYYNTTGIENVATGSQSLRFNTTGNSNTASGYLSLSRNVTGDYNTANGSISLYNNTNGSYNVANGYRTLQYNVTGSGNVANGAFSLYGNKGNYNSANGYNALYNSSYCNYNTANGYNALYADTSGDYNTANGALALANSKNADFNTADGARSLQANTIGVGNSAHGYRSLVGVTTGDYNTAIGYQAGNTTTGNNNVMIGSNANVPSATASNQIRIGDASITYAGTQVAWTYTSDKRLKNSIKTSELGLDFIKSLRPVSYIRNNDVDGKTEYGLIAQELEESLNVFGAKHTGIITKDDEGMYSVRYNDLLSPMIKATQQQQVIIEEQKKRIDALELMIKQLALKIK